ncbi:uncharacterized protein LOC115218061 [Octopus sinensis]|uniref:Uncharacterized protein LOC115218061 n=1 Tax=Octopus sinensis TaxID=2607531 RepID=A0A6P7SZU3_9MOLL|nr:uncharacterized protein LOC115218061 [Octopus sinensis]
MHLHHYSNLLLSSLILLLYVPTAHLTYSPKYPCRSTRPTQWERDPQNCSKYYFCIYGRPILMPACAYGLVWSQSGSACVEVNSYWDDCKPSASVSPTTVRSTNIRSTTTAQYTVPQTKLLATGSRITTAPPSPPTTTITTEATTTRASTTEATTTTPTTMTTILTSTIPTSTLNPKIPKDSPCLTQSGIIPHPKKCHLYYNCSLSSESAMWGYYEMFTVECKYPQLFDSVQLRCREFLNNNCNGRFEPVDPCEYRRNQCLRSHCQPCSSRFGSCRGRPDGIYPQHEFSWTPKYFTCYYERAIAHDLCESPIPIFSPIENQCVSYDMVPKEYGGLRPDCKIRANGLYADEMGRCNFYFQCDNAKFQGFHKCNYGFTFNPILKICQSPDQVPAPCGSGSPPSCVKRPDGFYADLAGRCSYYFECKQSVFKSFHKCSRGHAFNPYKRSCVRGIQSQLKPCGIQDNLCENRLTGFYLYNSSSSQYYECHEGLFIHFGTCPNGQTFNLSSKQCEIAEMKDYCANKADGRYKHPLGKCIAFLECKQQTTLRVAQCSDNLNGTRFNSLTRSCDLPQNVCPPCGYKWFDCPSYIKRTTKLS